MSAITGTENFTIFETDTQTELAIIVAEFPVYSYSVYRDCQLRDSGATVTQWTLYPTVGELFTYLHKFRMHRTREIDSDPWRCVTKGAFFLISGLVTSRSHLI